LPSRISISSPEKFLSRATGRSEANAAAQKFGAAAIPSA
jgi:hypothetical protein